MWRLHRKEPGCDVGEHIHVFFGAEFSGRWWWWWLCFWCGIRGEENRIVDEGDTDLPRVTRVGLVDRWRITGSSDREPAEEANEDGGGAV